MRQFKSGAIRSSNDGKIEYYGFRHPLIEKSFGEYMLRHQVQEDGKLRSSDNWWKGWDKEVSLQSLIRHLEDLTAIHAGYNVYKVRDKGEKTIYTKDEMKGEKVSAEDCLNAIKFNCNAYLLEILK